AAAEIHNFFWSPDGARLAVVAWDQEHGNRNLIFDVAAQQVEEALLPKYNVDGKEHTMTIAAWAPDGKRMLVSDDGWLYLIQIERQENRWLWSERKRITTDWHSILSLTCSF